MTTASTAPSHWDDVVAVSHRVLDKKSRSFSWAAKFLPAGRRDDAAVLYAFCRLVDDLVDEGGDDGRARAELERLSAELEGRDPARPIVRAFLEVARRRGLERRWALELIRGVGSDLGEVRMRDDRELLRYSYRVAGTVGLMMSPILGVDTASARPHAIDLGMAMQLTNICRDVAEDADVGRTYLPVTRLRSAGTSPEAILEGRADREAVAGVVRSVLDLAELYYESGRIGMSYIPRRSRLAIMVASRVYRGSGVKLRNRGADPLEESVSLGAVEKLRWVGSAAGSFFGSFRDTDTISHDADLHRAIPDMPGAHPPAGQLDAS